MDLEIGSGKGTFLVQQSALEPDTDFLGIEWAKAYWRHAADRLRRRGCENVRILWADATVFVKFYVGDAVLRRVHIYFPDPWPKKRHHKRRSVQAPFLRELHRVLQPDGEVRLATDHAEYFQWMEEHAAHVADLFDRQPFEKPGSEGEGELVGSNFERKYRREGRPFHAMRLIKK
jgi:tRNA (guanine-N7-)-methyltransferase